MTPCRGMRKGLTLLEVLLALTIATIVLGISLSVYNLWWRAYNPASEKAVIERELNSAMEIILERLRLAKEVELVQEIPNVINTDSVFIALSNGKVQMHGDRGASNLTGSSVSDLSFTILDLEEKLIEINLTSSTKYHEDISLSSTVRVLNALLYNAQEENSEYSSARFVRSERFFTSSDTTPDPQPDPDPDPDPEPDPEPTPILTVSSIDYETWGGTNHLRVLVNVRDDNNNSVSSASVSIELMRNGSVYGSSTSTTGSDGTATYEFRRFPSGTYTTVVTGVTKDDYEWDGQTPANQYVK